MSILKMPMFDQASFSSFFPGASSFFSDRGVDFRLHADCARYTFSQEDYLRQKHALDPGRVFNMLQEHGAHVVDVTEENFGPLNFRVRADAAVTNRPGIALSVRTADCFPVFFYEPECRCIGIVHAGWRGSRLKIIERTIDFMITQYACRAGQIRAVLGPAIRSCCYCVGEEFREYFPEALVPRGQNNYLDLALENKLQMIALGIRDEHIADSSVCTCCDPGCFSYRREGNGTGRHLSGLVMRSSVNG